MYKSVNSRGYGDRFIPRRSYDNFDWSHYHLNHTKHEKKDTDKINFPISSGKKQFFSYSQYFHKKSLYEKELQKILPPSYKNILNFSLKTEKNVKYAESMHDILWPVVPRIKPLLGPPAIVLDMPDLESFMYHQVIDWAKTGYIASIYQQEIHLWHEDQQIERLVITTDGNLEQFIKWNCDGTLLAMSLKYSRIGIWSIKKLAMLKMHCYCPCFQCTITVIEWSKDNHIITGCDLGRVSIFSPAYKFIKSFFPAHFDRVCKVRLSCNENMLISCGDDVQILIWKWPEFKEYLSINIEDVATAIAWHPWKENILAVACHSTIMIFNTSTSCLLHQQENNYHVDAMTFNPLTAELVVSFSGKTYPENNPSTSADSTPFIAVLKNLTCVVDDAYYHVGRVLYLFWNEDGTKMISVGSDEDLCLWDFFGEGKTVRRKQKRKQLTTDGFKNLDLFGSCIR